MSGGAYEIVVAGEMSAHLRRWFEDAEVEVGGGRTRLRLVGDDAQLHGALERLDALGLELLDLRAGSPGGW